MAYKHLTRDERVQIELLLSEHYDYSAIAMLLQRSTSTVSREIKRYYNPHWGYKAEFAHFHSTNKRKQANRKLRKIQLCCALELFILHGLRNYVRPEQISGFLKEHADLPYVCHETIYQHIYKFRREFIRYLRIRSYKQYNKNRKGTGVKIPNAVSIDKRPRYIETRQKLGHWEGDTIVGKHQQGAIATFVERKSGHLLAIKMEDRTASSMTKAALQAFKDVPKHLRKTCTNDNGSEFAEHEIWAKKLAMMIYFAHSYHSWERGSNENTNGLLRQFFPKGTDFCNITQEDIDWAVNLINNRPRKRLKYKTPAQVFTGCIDVCTLN
jgi:IS30 family transposase